MLFIGEVGIGKKVMVSVVGLLKDVIMEFGGKLLLLVFDDVDVL